MDTFSPILALLLPILLGCVCVRLLVPRNTVGHLAIVLGAGALIGLPGITLLMRLVDGMGLAISFRNVAIAAVAVMAAVLLINFFRGSPNAGKAVSNSTSPTLANWQKWLFSALLLLIVFRLLTLGLELIWRPLYPWDATMHWATKARVWFEASSIVPFVERQEWLELSGAGVFTDFHPDYPITTPLLQVWMNSAIGRWDNSLMNLPWLVFLVALLLLFYGQGLVAGVDKLTAIMFTYMLGSLPLVNTHVALAGYADLLLGSCYAAAIMSFHNWARSRERWQGILTLIFAALCPLIKYEGAFWVLTFIPAVVVTLLPKRGVKYFLAGTPIALIILWTILPKDLIIAGHSINELDFYYRPGALGYIVSTFFTYSSWNLLFYVAAFVIPVGLLMNAGVRASCLATAVVVATAFAFFLFLFTFTVYATGAKDITGASRIGLQLAPGLVFLTMLLFAGISARFNGARGRGEMIDAP